MKKRTASKLLSYLLAATMILSGLFISSPVLAEPLMEEVIALGRSAAAAYVESAKNNVTPEGLLAAVNNAINPLVATLDAKTNASTRLVTNLRNGACTDFFIKHSVPGVKDEYVGAQPEPAGNIPLEIKGSDGAVAAIFRVGDEAFGFSAAFAHTEEVININEVAVVGTSAGFTYDAINYITGYSGSADKIVIPSSWTGAMRSVSDKTYLNNIKAVVIDNKKTLIESSYQGWQGLIAVGFGSNAISSPSFTLFGQNQSTFNGCPNLKYVKLPDSIRSSWSSVYIPQNTFINCSKLENVNLPNIDQTYTYKSGNIAYRAFYNTAVRDFFVPQYAGAPDRNQPFNSPSFSVGTRNTILFNTNMTFTRAAALAAAKLNQEIRIQSTLDNGLLIQSARNAITGSADAATFRDALTFDWGDTWVNSDSFVGGVLTVSDNNGNSIPMTVSIIKALASLNVGYPITPAFDPSTLDYTVTVPYEVTSLTINAQPVEGATVGSITGNSNFVVGSSNVVSIPVTTAENNTVNYTINVMRSQSVVLRVEGATISTDGGAKLRFLTNKPETVPENSTIVAYGTLMIPNQYISEGANAYKPDAALEVGDSYCADARAESDTLPDFWYAHLSNSDNYKGVRIAARSYVIYLDGAGDQQVIYSNVVVRAVYEISYAMVTAIVENKTDINAGLAPDGIVWDENVTDSITDISAVAAESVQQFVLKNTAALQYYVDYIQV
ncbi:MAG: cadherin-like beta sandwich domain-containing protein [Oscillospiraceae bacterium]|nr:cadherin-like beta sandwich domain-containing protein [Oscillospiraceae bacterium]